MFPYRALKFRLPLGSAWPRLGAVAQVAPRLRYDRHGQSAVVSAIAFFVLITAIIGLLGLVSAPAVHVGDDPLDRHLEAHLQSINSYVLEPWHLTKRPAFMVPSREDGWWACQTTVHEIISSETFVELQFSDDSPLRRSIIAQVSRLPLTAVVSQVGLLYLAALIHILCAFYVAGRHANPVGFSAAVYMASMALVLVSSAIVLNRPLGFDPHLLRFFVSTFYVASAGIVSLVHFAVIFPRSRQPFTHWRWLIPAIYTFAVLKLFLYLTGVTALLTAAPLVVALVAIMVGAALSTALSAAATREARITGWAIAASGVIYVLAMFTPAPDDVETANMFSTFSVLLPLSLILGLEGCRNLSDRSRLAQRARLSQESIRQELHDGLLNDLAGIMAMSDSLRRNLHGAGGKGREDRLEAIRELAKKMSRNVRELLTLVDQEYETWEEFAGRLERDARQLLESQDTAFAMQVSTSLCSSPAPPISVKIALERTYREAVTNALKHAAARQVHASWTAEDGTVRLEIADDGRGFDLKQRDSFSHGLKNMARRAKRLGGHLQITSAPGKGTRLTVELPLEPAAVS